MAEDFKAGLFPYLPIVDRVSVHMISLIKLNLFTLRIISFLCDVISFYFFLNDIES
jgi:hypothetical protein